MIRCILLFLLFVSLGCNHSQVKCPPDVDFYQDIAKERNGRETFGFKFTRLIQSQLHFVDLSDGIPGWQIRVWLKEPGIESYKLYIIDDRNKKLNGAFYGFTLTNDPKLRKIENLEEGRLVGPLNELIVRLTKLGIFGLPDWRKINEYNLNSNHPGFVLIEVSSCKIYRYYEYIDLSENLSKHTQAGNIAQILEELKSREGNSS